MSTGRVDIAVGGKLEHSVWGCDRQQAFAIWWCSVGGFLWVVADGCCLRQDLHTRGASFSDGLLCGGATICSVGKIAAAWLGGGIHQQHGSVGTWQRQGRSGGRGKASRTAADDQHLNMASLADGQLGQRGCVVGQTT